MREFWSENGKFVKKLLLNQFGAAVMGLMITAASASQSKLMLFASLFATAFYLVLLYMVVWEKGGQDRIRVDGGRAVYAPLTGLKIALLANIPNMLFALLIIIGYIFGRSDSFAMEWAGNLYAIFNAVGRLWHGMYIGLIQTFSPHNPIAFPLVILPALFTCTFGYWMGLKNRRIFSMFELRPPKKSQSHSGHTDTPNEKK